MKDVNTILKQKIFDLLRPVISYPLYYKYLPAFVKENAYVTINIITNTDASTMQTSDTDTTILVGIYSRETQANPGQMVNDIAAAVYAVLYPDPQFKLDLSPGFQNCSVSLVNDIIPDAIATNTEILINRFLTFRFNIFHR
jgi:hypothetical protein